jgi:hypothetical protein
MNASSHQSQFLLALFVLLAIHTAVSLGAYRWLTKTTTLHESGEQPPVEITTPEQQARGEKSFRVVTKTQVISRMIPSPVRCYVWGGYAGLGVALLVWVLQQVRHAQP